MSMSDDSFSPPPTRYPGCPHFHHIILCLYKIHLQTSYLRTMNQCFFLPKTKAKGTNIPTSVNHHWGCPQKSVIDHYSCPRQIRQSSCGKSANGTRDRRVIISRRRTDATKTPTPSRDCGSVRRTAAPQLPNYN